MGSPQQNEPKKKPSFGWGLLSAEFQWLAAKSRGGRPLKQVAGTISNSKYQPNSRSGFQGEVSALSWFAFKTLPINNSFQALGVVMISVFLANTK